MNQSTIAVDAEAAAAHAPTMLKLGWIALALAMLGLGLLGFITGDFALNWQPVPAWVPGRTALAYLTAALFWALGAGLLIDRYKYSFAIASAEASHKGACKWPDGSSSARAPMISSASC